MEKNQQTPGWKRKAVFFLTSQTLSLFGSSLVQYALMWSVTLETGSGIMMTVFIICGFVPTFLLSPFAGVWADRYDRKKILVIADGLIALATLALAFVYMAGGAHLWLIFVTAAVRALGTAVQTPAVGAFLPQIVPPEGLTRVNGIIGTLQSAIMFASPIASGALMTFWPIQTIFFIDVGTAALAIAILLFLIPVPPRARAEAGPPSSYLNEMRLGFRYILANRYLVSFFAYVGVLLFFIAPAAFLTPLQVARTFGAEVWRLTAIEITFSVGMMAGGALIAAWGGFKNRVHTMLFAASVMAACTVLLGFMPNFWIYLAPMALFGIAMPFYNTPATVLIQVNVEEQYMGRVFGVFTMLMTSMMPLGMLVFGPLAEVVRIEWLLIGTGAVLLGLNFLVLGDKRLLAAGMKQAPAAAPTEKAE
ncbi:MAG: MFS transporter [Spirochaetales bacterium]|nr:MFS transporter [Spirochaetales bacterium]